MISRLLFIYICSRFRNFCSELRYTGEPRKIDSRFERYAILYVARARGTKIGNWRAVGCAGFPFYFFFPKDFVPSPLFLFDPDHKNKNKILFSSPPSEG